MADTAAHLVDRGLPAVPIRQWVLALPCLLRSRCAWGVYPGPSHGPGDFAALAPHETEDVARVLAGTARRIVQLLEARWRVGRSRRRGGESEALSGRASDSRADRRESLARRIAWADLLKRVFEVDVLRRPRWGRRMGVIAAITDPSVAQRILECLALSSRAPPLAPADEIGLGAVVVDRAYDSRATEMQSDPGFDSDQTSSESDGSADPTPEDDPRAA